MNWGLNLNNDDDVEKQQYKINLNDAKKHRIKLMEERNASLDIKQKDIIKLLG